MTTSATTGEQKIHLKKNFQYHLRGTKFCIPDAKPGRAKGQQKGGSGLILREDQAEWQDAVKAQERRREKEDRRVAKGTLQGWNDPDVRTHLSGLRTEVGILADVGLVVAGDHHCRRLWQRSERRQRNADHWAWAEEPESSAAEAIVSVRAIFRHAFWHVAVCAPQPTATELTTI